MGGYNPWMDPAGIGAAWPMVPDLIITNTLREVVPMISADERLAQNSVFEPQLSSVNGKLHPPIRGIE